MSIKDYDLCLLYKNGSPSNAWKSSYFVQVLCSNCFILMAFDEQNLLFEKENIYLSINYLNRIFHIGEQRF